MLISLPAIFRGIGLNPLAPGNVGYLLWMLMGYLVATAVLVVLFGRLGDMFGRVRIYNLGFVVFTAAAVALSFDPFDLGSGAMWLIGWRVIQGVGGAMLMASSSAILTDAFPANQRGMALGVNMVAAVAGGFLGLLVGGVLSEWDWRAIFWVGVPVGVLGTIWSFRSLREIGVDRRVPGGRPAGRGALGSHWGAAVHGRRDADDGRVIHRAGDDPGELRLRGVRLAHLSQRSRRRHLHRPEHRGDHVQRARRRTGCRLGVRATFFNAGSSLSIGVFFSLMIIGLAHTLPGAMSAGLQEQGVSAAVAQEVSNLPPVGSLFAAFLGYNPIAELLAPWGALHQPGVNTDVLTGQTFFPHLITQPFRAGLVVVFVAAAVMMLIGAVASVFNPGRYADADVDNQTEGDQNGGSSGSDEVVVGGGLQSGGSSSGSKGSLIHLHQGLVLGRPPLKKMSILRELLRHLRMSISRRRA